MTATRFKHHLLLPEIGGQGQKRLADARVLVIGAGGLGCPILDYLTRAGIGKLTIMDGDTVELSNLQRQTLYTEADLGRNKAEAAKDRLQTIGGDVVIDAVPRMFAEQSTEAELSDHDLVIEGIDRIEGRQVINKAAHQARVPLLSSAASRFSGQVALFAFEDGGGPCYRCLVPEEAGEEGLCDRDGVLGPVVGMTGSLAASEAIKWLCGVTPHLAGHLLILDALQGRLRRVTLPADPGCPVCSP